MATDKVTKHLVLDLRTKIPYALKLDEDGVCKSAEVLQMSVEDFDGMPIGLFGPSMDGDEKEEEASPIPYGKLTYAIELDPDRKNPSTRIYTISWPSEKEASKGVMPKVWCKSLPANLEKAGFAPAVPEKNARAPGLVDQRILDEAFADVRRMIGQEKAKEDVLDGIAEVRAAEWDKELGLGANIPSHRHKVFVGPPGVGKTTLVRAIGKAYFALGYTDSPEIIEVSPRRDFIAGYIGQSDEKAAKILKQAREERRILFIDEFPALFGEDDSKNDYGAKVLDLLLTDLENYPEDLIVFVAGQKGPMMNTLRSREALESRFIDIIEMAHLSLENLGGIMDQQLSERGREMTADAREHAMKAVAEKKARDGDSFANGRVTRNLVEKAKKKQAVRLDREGWLSKEASIPPENRKAAIQFITLEDVKKVDMKGLGGGERKKRVGFDAKRIFNSGAVRNDNTPPAPQEAAPPPSGPRRIGFGSR